MFSCLAPSAKGSKRFVDALAAELWDRRSGSAEADAAWGGADRHLAVAAWTATSGSEADFLERMAEFWASFEDRSPGWRWVAVALGPDKRTLVASVLFDHRRALDDFRKLARKMPALRHGRSSFFVDAPARFRHAIEAPPPRAAALWVRAVATAAARETALSEAVERVRSTLPATVVAAHVGRVVVDGGEATALVALLFADKHALSLRPTARTSLFRGPSKARQKSNGASPRSTVAAGTARAPPPRRSRPSPGPASSRTTRARSARTTTTTRPTPASGRAALLRTVFLLRSVRGSRRRSRAPRPSGGRGGATRGRSAQLDGSAAPTSPATATNKVRSGPRGRASTGSLLVV